MYLCHILFQICFNRCEGFFSVFISLKDNVNMFRGIWSHTSTLFQAKFMSLQFFAVAFWSETDMCLCYCVSEFDMHISVAFQMSCLLKGKIVTWTASFFLFVFVCVILPSILRCEDTWAIVFNYFNKWHINLLRSTLLFASLLGTSGVLT